MNEAKEKYLNKKPEEFRKFSEKIACSRINYIKGKKKKRGLSLADAAKKIGITPMYLSMLENEKRQVPNSVILYKIERVYGFRIGELAQILARDSLNTSNPKI